MESFGLTHVLLAAYVRCIAKYPGVNRFFSGQRVYQRDDDVQFTMTIKKDMRTDGEESWVGWYARSTGTQWALGAEDSAQSVLHSACGILKTLGYDVAVAPEDAENVTYSVLEIDGQTVAETAFTLDGIPYRWHVGTGDSEDPERLVDLSGSERVYPHTEETTIRWCRAELSDDPGNAGCKLIWIDIAPGLAYSLETDGTVPPEALQELAESLFVPAQGEEG